MSELVTLPFSCLIFDLDGTLVDSAPDVQAALNHAFSDFSVSFERVQIQTFLAHGLDGLIQGAFSAVRLSPTTAQYESAKNAYLQYYKKNPVVHTTVFPGAIEVLRGLKNTGIQLGICSNKPSETARLVVETLKLDEFFSVIVAGDDTPRKKPDPLHVVLSLKKLGAHSGSSVMIGDSSADLEAGRLAGLKTLLFSQERVVPDVLSQLADGIFFEYRDFLTTLFALRRSGHE